MRAAAHRDGGLLPEPHRRRPGVPSRVQGPRESDLRRLRQAHGRRNAAIAIFFTEGHGDGGRINPFMKESTIPLPPPPSLLSQAGNRKRKTAEAAPRGVPAVAERGLPLLPALHGRRRRLARRLRAARDRDPRALVRPDSSKLPIIFHTLKIQVKNV